MSIVALISFFKSAGIIFFGSVGALLMVFHQAKKSVETRQNKEELESVRKARKIEKKNRDLSDDKLVDDGL